MFPRLSFIILFIHLSVFADLFGQTSVLDRDAKNARIVNLSRHLFETFPLLVPPRHPFALGMQIDGYYQGKSLKSARDDTDLEPTGKILPTAFFKAGFRLPVADLYTAHLTVWAGGILPGSERLIKVEKKLENIVFGFALSPSIGQRWELSLPLGVQRSQGAILGRVLYSDRTDRLKGRGTYAYGGLGFRHLPSGLFMVGTAAKRSYAIELRIEGEEDPEEYESTTSRLENFVYSGLIGIHLPFNISVAIGGYGEKRAATIPSGSLSFGKNF